MSQYSIELKTYQFCEHNQSSQNFDLIHNDKHPLLLGQMDVKFCMPFLLNNATCQYYLKKHVSLLRSLY